MLLRTIRSSDDIDASSKKKQAVGHLVIQRRDTCMPDSHAPFLCKTSTTQRQSVKCKTCEHRFTKCQKLIILDFNDQLSYLGTVFENKNWSEMFKYSGRCVMEIFVLRIFDIRDGPGPVKKIIGSLRDENVSTILHVHDIK